MSTIHYGSNSQAECGASDGLVSLKAAEVTCRTCRGWLPIVAPELQAPVYPTAIHSDGEAPIPLSAAMLDAVRTWSRNDRLWGSRSATEFNLCTFARVILKAHAEGK
jgi:hypothetical protein